MIGATVPPLRGNVAEQRDDGSRGLQPTVKHRCGTRRVATDDVCSPATSTVADATGSCASSNRGLKSTATVTASLREAGAVVWL